jgi:hypothetical protein
MTYVHRIKLKGIHYTLIHIIETRAWVLTNTTNQKKKKKKREREKKKKKMGQLWFISKKKNYES